MNVVGLRRGTYGTQSWSRMSVELCSRTGSEHAKLQPPSPPNGNGNGNGNGWSLEWVCLGFG